MLARSRVTVVLYQRNLERVRAGEKPVTVRGLALDKELLGDSDLLNVSYRFAGELVDVEAVLERAQGPVPSL